MTLPPGDCGEYRGYCIVWHHLCGFSQLVERYADDSVYLFWQLWPFRQDHSAILHQRREQPVRYGEHGDTYWRACILACTGEWFWMRRQKRTYVCINIRQWVLRRGCSSPPMESTPLLKESFLLICSCTANLSFWIMRNQSHCSFRTIWRWWCYVFL